MSSTIRGRSGPSRYAKRAASGPRDRRPPRLRRESSSTTRHPGNGDASPSFHAQADAGHIEEPPQWFLVYMERFKKQIIAEMMKSLDAPLEDEEKQRRYKKSYFILRSRLHNLEKQMENQSYSSRNSQQQSFNGSSKSQDKSTSRRSNNENSSGSPPASPPASNDRENDSPLKSKRRSWRFERKPEEDPEVSAEKEDLEGEEQVKPDEEKQLDLSKKIRSILNKLTSSNFQNLLDQIKHLNIEKEADEQEFINQFFEKAIDEPMYSTTYALMCKQFVLLQTSMLRLRGKIIARCETEFEKHVELDALKAKKLGELLVANDSEREKLRRELEEMKPKEFMGDILFIGELYNQDLLCNNFLHKVIQHLVQSSDETDYEYLCKLLKNCGKNFELRGEDPGLYYEKLIELSEKEGLCSRIKFMIKDLIEMRARSWNVKRGEEEEKEEEVVESFSFSKSLDDCADRDDFMEAFYRAIQPQFNFFESTNFTRELLNSVVERTATRKRYFDVFTRSEGNKIVEWVGGDEVFFGIVVRELGLFFKHVEDVAEEIPEVWESLKQFTAKIVDEWEREFAAAKVFELLEAVKNIERRKKFAVELIDVLSGKMGRERLQQWLPEEIRLSEEEKN